MKNRAYFHKPFQFDTPRHRGQSRRFSVLAKQLFPDAYFRASTLVRGLSLSTPLVSIALSSPTSANVVGSGCSFKLLKQK